MGHLYAAPYAILEPALVLVIVADDRVMGFAAGAIDTARWEKDLERHWWPSLRRQYPDPDRASFASWTADPQRGRRARRR